MAMENIYEVQQGHVSRQPIVLSKKMVDIRCQTSNKALHKPSEEVILAP